MPLHINVTITIEGDSPFAEQIRKANLRDIGRRIGVSHTSIVRWLQGKRSMKLEYAQAVAEAIGYSMIYDGKTVRVKKRGAS